MSSKDKDFRLVTLVVDVCPLPLRELFLKYAKSDPGPGVPYSSLDNYMLFRKQDVENLMKLRPKTIRKDQFDMIYPKANEVEWDVSLLSALLLGLFGTKVQGTEESLIRIIRETRNKLQHKPGSLTTTDTVFDTTWKEIETAITSLALNVGGPTYEAEIKNRIDETRVNNLPKLGDTLKSWYENTLHSISETYRILEATTEKRETKTGHTSKRMKTVDTILQKLREQFAQTFYRELPDDYAQPNEASTIRQNLTHDHHVTICGYEKSKYLACALSVIADLDYDRSRCVEMTKPGDWRHVDPEEVDLILYHDPFSLSVTEKKRELFDVFQALMDVSTTSDDQARIDVVIVTERCKLEENGDFKCHDIFENMVVLYEPTNEKEPVDLAKHQIHYKRTQKDSVLRNMI
ncbi:uncharacterized protein LOC128552751, partial [Mercenaria mercenaria]|uniref:uncharacterized protein LOC128552751 n=1 Tax=Mercenaria mercenaria TaxID=6596 RepID=UPI00234F92FC